MAHIIPPGLENYRGNKGVNGLYQWIINEIPPHQTYIELFLGSGAIYRYKKKAAVTYGIDCNRSVIDAWKPFEADDLIIWHANALQILPSVPDLLEPVFIYLDPPYYYPSRKSAKAIYASEFSNTDHEKLISMILKVKHNCMISCYDNLLYFSYLSDWRKKTFQVCVHGKVVNEIIYMNYPEPTELHDYSYLGTDCWDRQRIKRKISARLATLNKLPALERNAIIQSILKKYPGSSI